MLSKSEWMHEADRAAAHRYGEKYAKVFAFRKFAAAPAGVLVLAGAAGFGAWKLWTSASTVFRSGPAVADGIPALFWILAAMLAIVTGVVLRPRLIPRPKGVKVLIALALGIVWLGMAGYLVGLL